MSIRTPIPRLPPREPSTPPRARGIQRNLVPMIVAGGLFFFVTQHLTDRKPAYELQEMFRVPSPDKKVDAVVYRQKASAPTHRVQVVRAGTSAAKADEPHGLFQGAVRFDGEPGVDVRWLPENRLEVRYRSVQGGALNTIAVIIDQTPYIIELTSR